MRDRNRLRNILAAGLLTGLVLATIVAFGWRDVQSSAASSGAADNADDLQVENEQLRQAVEQLQGRETSYQAEIEAANQIIRELQSPATNAQGYDDDEEHEEHEDEDEDGWWDND